MSTVFTALILLSVFNYLFNKLFTRRAEKAGVELLEPEPPPCPPPDEADDEDALDRSRRRAAAIAVAVALVEQAKRAAIFNPRPTSGSTWGQEGRRRQLSPWGRHG